jgi:unsaturated rhamnogalacturonyl hydrolase
VSGAGAGSAGANTSGSAGKGGADGLPGLPPRASVLEVLRRANAYFVAKWPDPAKAIDSSHPSHIWTRAVYYEGLLGLYAVDPEPSDLDYALSWAQGHSWGLNGGTTTRSADNQCAGQTYLDLYALQPDGVRIADIKNDIDTVVASAAVEDWTWVDAIQMAMPVFAKLGASTGQTAYYAKMYAMYSSAKNAQGAAGFYSKTDHLWWRDASYDPPYAEPNGKNCYWSRGNGWVFAALTRVLDTIPASEAHRSEYLADFAAMAEALRAVQRSDGFWNVSLHDETHFGGPELTGTSLFAYGMAWGVRKGHLATATYRPVIEKAWKAMASSVHDDGFLGYVQGTGQQPSDGQPVTFDKQPNYEDFGLGCLLLGGSEVARLAAP